MIGDCHNEYRAAIRFENGAGSWKCKTEGRMIEETCQEFKLPAKIGLGDYVIQVRSEEYCEQTDLESMPSWVKGFVLRVKNA